MRGERTVPADDAAFLDKVTGMIRSSYAMGDPQTMLGAVQGRPGSTPRIRYITAPDVRTTSDKIGFMNLMRHTSIRTGSQRSAIAFESWTARSTDPVVMERVRRLVKAGRSISKDPAAVEQVMVLVESEAGRTVTSFEIDRRHERKGMITLNQNGDPLFMPREGEMQGYGILSDFHVSLADRLKPATVAWAAQMDAVAARSVHVPRKTQGPADN